MSQRPRKQGREVLALLSTTKHLPLTTLKAKGFERMRPLLKKDFTLASNSLTSCVSQGSVREQRHHEKMGWDFLIGI